MTEKFTKGPWQWDGHWLWGGGELLLYYTTSDDGVHCENEADAHLIAAAPELYEALQECLREHGGFTIKGECERRAKDALSRARGEKQ